MPKKKTLQKYAKHIVPTIIKIILLSNILNSKIKIIIKIEAFSIVDG